MKQRQQTALEKITGMNTNRWLPEAIKAYFAFTDRGERQEMADEARADYDELIAYHHRHAIDIASWRHDFRVGLLTLEDFRKEFSDKSTPDNYLKHILEIYKGAVGPIPSKYAAWASRLDIERFCDTSMEVMRRGRTPEEKKQIHDLWGKLQSVGKKR